MVLELMTGRDIFDFINCGGGFQEKTVRFYFNQMLQAMHYIHSMGICHRDLKPANIMLDDQFNIRIADFGFATTIKGNGSGLLKRILGSPAYMAPEFYVNPCSYQGHVVDLFALGILLFNLFSGTEPFKKAKSSDPQFEKIALNRYDTFWASFEHIRDFPEDFKDLINNMLQLNPLQRLSMADIVGHPWMLGEMATPEEVQEEIRKRVRAVTSSRKAESLKRKNSRGSSSNTRGVRRGGEDGGYEEENK